MKDNPELRQELINTARAMNERGINVNKSGNVSVRAYSSGEGTQGFLITPTGIPYDNLEAGDIVFVPLHGGEHQGRRNASSEYGMHAEVYRRRLDAVAIVHTHSPYATALACQRLRIPAFHYMVAVAGGDSIEVAPYRTFGTLDLAEVAASALSKRNACLLEHHGVLALGRGLAQALNLATEVENLARQYVLVRGLGEPRLLEEAEMRRVIQKFASYGCQSDGVQHRSDFSEKPRSAPPSKWTSAEGTVVACTEKIKMLNENWEEAHSVLTEMFEDAILMGVGKAAFRRAMHELIDGLECTFDEKREG